MLLLEMLADLIVIFMFDLTFVYIAKYLFEESVIIDRRSALIIMADTVLNTAYGYSGIESSVISVIEIILSFSLLFFLTLISVCSLNYVFLVMLQGQKQRYLL